MKHKKVYTKIVKALAECSTADKEAVGALIIKNNRIISTGYNGHLPGKEHKAIMRDNHDISTIHAEQNALMNCTKLGISTDDAIMFVTHSPCLVCTKLAIMAGIRKIYYLYPYKDNENPFINEIEIQQL